MIVQKSDQSCSLSAIKWRRAFPDKSSRIEPLNRQCGASLLLLLREVEEKGGMRRGRGTGGEAFLHEVHREGRGEMLLAQLSEARVPLTKIKKLIT